MLNHSTENMPWRSSRALKMRCATYPPPPGSAPGYQKAHHWRPRYTAKVITGTVHRVSAENGREKSGKNANGSDALLAARNFSILAIIGDIPPAARTP